MTTENKQSDWGTVRGWIERDSWNCHCDECKKPTLVAMACLEAQAEAREKRIAELEVDVASARAIQETTGQTPLTHAMSEAGAANKRLIAIAEAAQELATAWEDGDDIEPDYIAALRKALEVKP